jgi:hypothetical protein
VIEFASIWFVTVNYALQPLVLTAQKATDRPRDCESVAAYVSPRKEVNPLCGWTRAALSARFNGELPSRGLQVLAERGTRDLFLGPVMR